MFGGEYLTSNANVAWPFFSDCPDLNHGVASMFCDGAAMLYTSEVGCSVDIVNLVVISERLDEQGNGAGATRIAFRVEKRRNGEVVDFCTIEATLPEGGRSEYTVVRQPWCFFIFDNLHASRFIGGIAGGHYAMPLGLRFPLDPSAVDLVADKITSLTLINGNGTSPNGWIPIVGDVQVREGTNIKLSQVRDSRVSDAGDDPTANLLLSVFNTQNFCMNGILITAGPGLGAGTVKCDVNCDEVEKYNNKGNLVPDDDGAVVFEGDDCFQISPQRLSNGMQLVRITGRCSACCQCEDYASTGDRLADQSHDVKDVKTSLLNSAEEYNKLATAHNKR